MSEVLSTETKFTPGPWDLEHLNWTVYANFDGERHAVASMGYDKAANACLWSNARLIAAAPDLYEALQFIYERIADPERSPRDLYPALGLDAMRAIDMASAALARARGGSSNEGE